jgi:serine phosphatase RsbU (regulator of sigma subunit)
VTTASGDAPQRAPTGDEASWLLSRRWLPLLALAGLLLFAAVAGALAWHQYRDAQRTALNDARSRAVVASAVFNVYFAGELGTLSSIAKAPVVVDGDEAGMLAYFRRLEPANAKLFNGGIAWIDRNGLVRVSSNGLSAGPPPDVSDRDYFRTAIRTGQPFVSEGLTSRRSHQQVIPMAVPTRDAQGAITGVLVGTRLIKPTSSSSSTIDLGYAGLVIVDRKDQSILFDFAHPRLPPVVRSGKAASGVLSDTRGLDGAPGHVIAYARATVPQWTIVLDRPRSAIFAAARRSLVLELVLIGGVALLDLALLAWILARARAQARRQLEQARQRRLQYEEEHRVATTLQRSLLPSLPQIASIDGAARYQAGSTGLEVGGDWYDVLRRPDGILHLTVGDVAGRGVAAAALMGQLRNAFRAYAYDHVSPAAIVRGLLRHMGDGEMATAVCLTVNPYGGVVTYASAGHPPSLLRDDETGEVTRLDSAQAPPLGFAAAESVREARLALPRRATLLAYTDGVIERRDRPIDHGIERLESAFGAAPLDMSASDLADAMIHQVAEVTAADDDIALLVIRLLDVPAGMEPELASDPVLLAEMRRGSD